MSHRVVVQSDLELPPHPSVGLILDDDSALALRNYDGHHVTAISPSGPHAIFNRRQTAKLVEELRAVSKVQPRVIQININEIIDYIEEHVTARDDRYVIFFTN